MCGIAGILREDVDLREQEQLLCQMSDSLRSRGPDDSGRYLEPGAALLHRRLAIIDPAGGRQPMRFGDLVIAYNGEIYNTAEVRHLLESAGYSFETACDTEVVLKAYHKWKAGCLEKLNGIFAFAVYDTRRGTLFAARDRIGVKPLFYCKKRATVCLCQPDPYLAAAPGGGAGGGSQRAGRDLYAGACPLPGARGISGSGGAASGLLPDL